MGETGGYSPWMTVFYEMLREYHIGVNVWTYKAVADCDAACLLEFQPPGEWKTVLDYANHGGKKPAYDRAISIFNELLENIKFENCRQLNDRCDAILRRPGVRIPAVGYDVLPGMGESFFGDWPYCVSCGYRREDRMHLTEEPGHIPYDGGWLAMLGNPVEKYGDWPHLELRLEAGHFACYHIYQVEKGTLLKICYRGKDRSKITVWQDEHVLFAGSLDEMPETETAVGEIGVLEAKPETVLKIKAETGCCILKDLIIEK